MPVQAYFFERVNLAAEEALKISVEVATVAGLYTLLPGLSRPTDGPKPS